MDATDPATMTPAARSALVQADEHGALFCHWRVTDGLVRRGLARRTSSGSLVTGYLTAAGRRLRDELTGRS